jgi:hypothetical protein
MEGYIEGRKIVMDTVSNELTNLDQEAEITKTPVQYYERRATIFYERKGETTDSVRIKRLLEKNNTNYKVILSPLYEQIKFNNADFSILKTLFGANLFDFSGKNVFTESKFNYYEASHYRPHVGDSIMKIIYTE